MARTKKQLIQQRTKQANETRRQTRAATAAAATTFVSQMNTPTTTTTTTTTTTRILKPAGSAYPLYDMSVSPKAMEHLLELMRFQFEECTSGQNRFTQKRQTVNNIIDELRILDVAPDDFIELSTQIYCDVTAKLHVDSKNEYNPETAHNEGVVMSQELAMNHALRFIGSMLVPSNTSTLANQLAKVKRLDEHLREDGHELATVLRSIATAATNIADELSPNELLNTNKITLHDAPSSQEEQPPVQAQLKSSQEIEPRQM